MQRCELTNLCPHFHVNSHPAAVLDADFQIQLLNMNWYVLANRTSMNDSSWPMSQSFWLRNFHIVPKSLHSQIMPKCCYCSSSAHAMSQQHMSNTVCELCRVGLSYLCPRNALSIATSSLKMRLNCARAHPMANTLFAKSLNVIMIAIS